MIKKANTELVALENVSTRGFYEKFVYMQFNV